MADEIKGQSLYFYNGSNISWESNGLIGGNTMTRKRYIELVKIAEELCTWLEKKGVEPTEGCSFKAIAEKLWELTK